MVVGALPIFFTDSTLFSVGIFVIIVGGIILIVSFFGCCGAIKENRCMLITVRSYVTRGSLVGI